MSNAWIKLLFWLYLLVLIWGEGTFQNPVDPDLWHRFALGEALAKTGHFPPGDTFSYLADYQTIADHEWGSAVIFYALYQRGGEMVFVFLKLATLTTTMVLVVWAGMGRRRPTILTTAFYALILLALLPSFQSTVRCMVFTHIFLALWLYWFQRERHGFPVHTIWYVLTMLLWANLHGGFAIGLAWLALVVAVEFWEGGRWRAWSRRLALCTLVTLINPFGVELWISTVRALTTSRRNFGEWEPVPWWNQIMVEPGYKVLLIGLSIALVLLIWKKKWRRVDQQAVLILLVFMALSLTSARHTSLFAVVAGALAPGLFPRELSVSDVMDPIRRMAYMALLSTLLVVPFFAALCIMPGDGLILVRAASSCPVAAVDYLKYHRIRGNLLVPFNYGSYALWELRGQMRVSMDGRYDLVYRRETFQRVFDFYQAKGNWQSMLTSPPAAAVLVPVSDPVYPKLKTEPGWTEAWTDKTDAIFLPQPKTAGL